MTGRRPARRLRCPRSAEEIRDAATHFTRPLPARLWDDLRATGLVPYEVPVPRER